MKLPSLAIAIAFNKQVRTDDEWFEDPDELDRVERALAVVARAADGVGAAALVAFEITRAQGFTEGNKRTALLLARWILDRNGLDGSTVLPPADRQVADLLVRAARGEDVGDELLVVFQSRARS